MDIAQIPPIEVLQIHDTPQWCQICFLTAEQAFRSVPVSEEWYPVKCIYAAFILTQVRLRICVRETHWRSVFEGNEYAVCPYVLFCYWFVGTLHILKIWLDISSKCAFSLYASPFNSEVIFSPIHIYYFCVVNLVSGLVVIPRKSTNHTDIRASQVARVVKNPLANAGDIRDLGFIPGSGRSPGGGNGNPLTSVLAWSIPWTEEPGELQSIGLYRVAHDWVTCTSILKDFPWVLSQLNAFLSCRPDLRTGSCIRHSLACEIPQERPDAPLCTHGQARLWA